MDQQHAKYNQVILWVDDDPLILDCGGEALEALGYRPITAKSGSEAIDIYSRYQEGISLVILDMIMPFMNGVEAHERLTYINPDVKVLIVTGCYNSEPVRNLLSKCGTDLIQKPFTLHTLSKQIDKLLSRAYQGKG